MKAQAGLEDENVGKGNFITNRDLSMKSQRIWFEDEYGCIQKVQACYIEKSLFEEVDA